MDIVNVVDRIKATWQNSNVKQYIFFLMYADLVCGGDLIQAQDRLGWAPNLESKEIAPTEAEREKKIAALKELIKGIELKDLGLFCDLILRIYQESGGKCAGQFFTPPEVGQLMAKIAHYEKGDIKTVFDPTCGAGNLLEATKNEVDNDLTLYGVELNFNMYLACLVRLHKDKNKLINSNLFSTDYNNIFDFVISNPPFGINIKGTRHGKVSADWAFILEGFKSLNENGVMCVQHEVGILYKNSDEKIRQEMAPFIHGIIKLPPNIFINTRIGTVILILKKTPKQGERFVIDASNDWAYTTKQRLNIVNKEAIFELWKNREAVEGKCGFTDDFDFRLKVEEEKEILDPRALMDEIEKLDMEARENMKKLRELVYNLEGWQ